MKDNLGILVKATHLCNLNCEYCYDKPNREKFGNKVLTKEMLQKAIKLGSEYSSHINWIWHGGEPTCAPINLYKDIQEDFNKKYKTTFDQSMQSNGTLWDDNWREFAHDYNIRAGFSYDGIKTLRTGTNKYDLINNFKKYLDTNKNLSLITVINNDNVERQTELYNELKGIGSKSICFNHIFHFNINNETDSQFIMTAKKYLIETNKFRNFLLTSQDLDYERTFNLTFQTLFGYTYSLCTNGDCRYKWLGISPDGSLFPCDREYSQKYCCGNIMDYNSIEEIFNSAPYQLYVAEIERKYKEHCYPCPYFYHCNGGCNGNSIAKFGTAAKIDEDSCQYFYLNFNSTYLLFRELDVYKNNFNPLIVDFLINTNSFTPLEIKNAILKELNIDYDFIDKNNNIFYSKDLLYTKEYLLFRLFNPLSGDYVEKDSARQTIPFIIQGDFTKERNLKIVQENRENGLQHFVNINANKIFNILKGENK